MGRHLKTETGGKRDTEEKKSGAWDEDERRKGLASYKDRGRVLLSVATEEKHRSRREKEEEASCQGNPLKEKERGA